MFARKFMVAVAVGITCLAGCAGEVSERVAETEQPMIVTYCKVDKTTYQIVDRVLWDDQDVPTNDPSYWFIPEGDVLEACPDYDIWSHYYQPGDPPVCQDFPF